jgi:hypothetical protein
MNVRDVWRSRRTSSTSSCVMMATSKASGNCRSRLSVWLYHAARRHGSAKPRLGHDWSYDGGLSSQCFKARRQRNSSEGGIPHRSYLIVSGWELFGWAGKWYRSVGSVD